MREQFAALMQQQAQLTTTVQQLVQLQHAQQAAGGTASPSYPEQAGLRSAKIFDLRHFKYTTFGRTPSKYDDWAFSFKRAIRASTCDAYKMLVHVERANGRVSGGCRGSAVRSLADGKRFCRVVRFVVSGLHGGRIVLHTCCGRYARTHCLATIIQEVQPQDHGASHSPCRGSHAPAEGQRVEARGGGVGQVGRSKARS